ncbi:MAG: UDP-N-acetylmuramoyl-tripeptide--D-alanyl-D-alanine ligase [Spirochaetaceae bacterium]|nr:UDP-N-acetylmuramoyl-tripeptide--D-alanyl-D-alanine ligase [Spirochaetaceae bacterium]
MNSADLAKALKAELVSSQNDSAPITQVSIDSRKVSPGALFVALIGSAVDSHLFVEEAFRAGAVAAMVDRKHYNDPVFRLAELTRRYYTVLIVVENTLQGLQNAAAWYLSRFPALIRIGITGSSGKTTTKEIAAAMLAYEKSVIMNEGNLNSETGLPLSVFMVRDYHEVGIFEMGMNRHNEIDELAKILKPQIALITNIGTAHVGTIGSQKLIALEKKAIFSYFSGTETALIPAYDEYRALLAEGVKGQVVFYDSAFEAVKDKGIEGNELLYERMAVDFKLSGSHNVKNAAAACAIARAVPVSSAAIRHGLAHVQPLFGRTEIVRGPVTVICDCYNANPQSMSAALEWCDNLAWIGKKIYVIGSMLELGAYSVAAHEHTGHLLSRCKADLLCFFGKETLPALSIVEQDANIPCFYSESINEVSEILVKQVQKGDLVLLKGSRGCALERVMEVLRCY